MSTSLSPQDERRMRIHRRTPSPSLRLISSTALICKKKRKLFHTNFITSPLAVHPSKPLFVHRNLGILSEPLAWVSRWGVSWWVWKGFQRRGAAISSKHGLHVQGLSWPWSQVGHMQQPNSHPSYPNGKPCPLWGASGGHFCCLLLLVFLRASWLPERCSIKLLKWGSNLDHLGFHLQ